MLITQLEPTRQKKSKNKESERRTKVFCRDNTEARSEGAKSDGMVMHQLIQRLTCKATESDLSLNRLDEHGALIERIA
jgi:hypothetical protein